MTHESINLRVTPKQAEVLASRVAPEHHRSTEHAIRSTAARLERKGIRLLIQEGLDAIDRGDVVDAGTVYGRIAKRHQTIRDSGGSA